MSGGNDVAVEGPGLVLSRPDANGAAADLVLLGAWNILTTQELLALPLFSVMAGVKRAVEQ
jgi:hypothetical protein